MKDIRIFGADFERSKRIVTQGDFALAAGIPTPFIWVSSTASLQ